MSSAPDRPRHLGVREARARSPRARRGYRPAVERLENYRLLASVVTPPTQITSNTIGPINEFSIPTPGSQPEDITTGPDGNLWFTEGLGNSIGMIDTITHVISEFPLPTPYSDPSGITAGPDGNLWFTAVNGNQVGMIDPTTHAITTFGLPTSVATPYSIVAGPDGNLWFTEPAADQIGVINPTTDAITEFPIVSSSHLDPHDIAVGPDGNLWFTEATGDAIGMINPATHAIASFPLPTNLYSPVSITAGPDGNLWFTEYNPDQPLPPPTSTSAATGASAFTDSNGYQLTTPSFQIGTINPVTHAITEFPVSNAGYDANGITAGPDGKLWFTVFDENELGTIDPVTHVVNLSTLSSVTIQDDGLTAITTGPDGNVWFTELYANKIGEVALKPQAPVSPTLGSSPAAPQSPTVGPAPSSNAGTSSGGTSLVTGPIWVAGVAQNPKGLRSIALGFDVALKPSLAQNPRLYLVRGAVESRGTTQFREKLRIQHVGFDALTRTVNITLAKRYPSAVKVTLRPKLLAAAGVSKSPGFSTVVA